MVSQPCSAQKSCQTTDTARLIRLNEVMRKIGDQVHEEATKRGMASFTRYVDEAHTAALGIETIVGLLRRGQANHENQTEDTGAILSPFDIGNLLGLIQYAARSLHENADRIKTWAGKHLVGESKPKHGR